MHKRQLAVVGIVLIGATILFAIATFRQQAQDKSQPQEDEPTVVKKGQVTDKEHEYSKEYKELYIERKGRKLSEISQVAALSGNTQEVRVIIGEPNVPTIIPKPAASSSEFLRDLSCKADAIVFGYVKNKSAHLTEDETFVFTEYEFSVQEILKDNSASPIEINNSIQLTRPGGVIKLDSQIIRVEDRSYAPLQMKNKYLLFLRFLPSTNGYVVSSFKGDFMLQGNSFKKLSLRALPKELENNNDSQILLNNVANSVKAGCNQNSMGGM
jgi:hypothetical protein